MQKWLKILGPGLLWAGAAVGVSHLVQSTRAGANFGFEFVMVLILANLTKYPFFEFAPRYAAATGEDLIKGYRRLGKWAVVMFAAVTLLTMFAIQAAVTIVTAGLVASVFGLKINLVVLTGIILAVAAVILMAGRFALLDNLMKVIIITLTLATIIAVFAAMGQGFNPNPDFARHFSWTNHLDVVFLLAFVGWMPAPIDVSVWHSKWTIAKNEGHEKNINVKNTLLDFNIGFFTTMILAVGFLSLGALLMYGSGETFSPKGAVFAEQLINLYTNSIGQWAYPIIAVAALTTMFSTTLTVLDAYPRVMAPITAEWLKVPETDKRTNRRVWFVWLFVTIAGALLLLSIFSFGMKAMVDLATIMSFVIAPVLAWLNYKAVMQKHVPAQHKPKRWLQIYAQISVFLLVVFSLVYIFWQFFA